MDTDSSKEGVKNQIDIAEQAQTEEVDTKAILAQFDRESNVRQFSGIRKIVLRYLLIGYSLFALWTNVVVILPEQIKRASFIGIAVFIAFILFPAKRKYTQLINHIHWYDLVLGSVGAACFFYYVLNFNEIAARTGMYTSFEVVVGIVGIIILLEICRRAVGMPIVLVVLAFVAYAFWAGFSYKRIVTQLFYTMEGVIGIPLQVCSTFIVLFILFGSFLEKTGVGQFFIDVANSIAGFATGGPAKVAVIASALEGMVSGSSVSNTVGSGSFTIPMMKKMGYRPEFAAAVEAAASTGGQIMPPVMGAAAFLMSEMTGIPYSNIVIAAFLPALLYFTGIFLMIHFEAKKLGLKGLERKDIPIFGKLMITKGFLLLPLFVIIYLMMTGFTPATAAFFSIVSAIIVCNLRKDTIIMFLMPIVMGLSVFLIVNNTTISYSNLFFTIFLPVILYCLYFLLMIFFEGKKSNLSVFEREDLPKFGKLILKKWFLLIPLFVFVYVLIICTNPVTGFNAMIYNSIVDSSLINSLTFGMTTFDSIGIAVILSIGVAIIISMLKKNTTLRFPSAADALENGARTTIGVAIACSVAGIIIGIVTLTGIGLELATGLLNLSGGIPIVALFLTMVACIVLGMGVPTTANYVIMAMITAPIVVKLGVPLLAAHMFVFYFGIVADITPPVALAAYAGAAIAKSNPFKTAVTATRLAITAFIIPFIFALSPSLLLTPASLSDPALLLEVLFLVVTAFAGMYSIAAGMEGFMLKRMPIWQRVIALTAGLLLIIPGWVTDLIGFSLLVVVILLQYFSTRPKNNKLAVS